MQRPSDCSAAKLLELRVARPTQETCDFDQTYWFRALASLPFAGVPCRV